jgi:branched-chain amino acid transport system substrate-binding protein
MLATRSALMAGLAILTLTATACGGAAADRTTTDYSPAARSAAQQLGIDLDSCPTDITQPLPAEIKIGQTLPQTGGPGTAYAPVGKGLKAYLDKLNADHALPNGTTVTLVQKDDAFQPDKARTEAKGLVERDRVDFLTEIVSTAQVMAVRDVAESECVPLLAGAAAGTPVFDAQRYPMSIMVWPPFMLDTRIWVASLAQRFPQGAKIALFTSNTESGKDYVSNVKKLIAGTPHTIVAEQTIEAADASAPAPQVTTMRNSGADVALLAPVAGQCPAVLTEMANQGWRPTTYLTSVCGSTTSLAPAGEGADGTLVAMAVKDPKDPAMANDPGVAQVNAVLKAQGVEPALSSYIGYMHGEFIGRALQAAAGSELGLSRLGVLYAASRLDYPSPVLLDGVSIKLDMPGDPFAFEAARLVQYEAADNGFTPGELYDFEGQLPTTP